MLCETNYTLATKVVLLISPLATGAAVRFVDLSLGNQDSPILSMFQYPRRACAARVTVLGPSVCLSVCVCPSLLQLASRTSVGDGI